MLEQRGEGKWCYTIFSRYNHSKVSRYNKAFHTQIFSADYLQWSTATQPQTKNNFEPGKKALDYCLTQPVKVKNMLRPLVSLRNNIKSHSSSYEKGQVCPSSYSQQCYTLVQTDSQDINTKVNILFVYTVCSDKQAPNPVKIMAKFLRLYVLILRAT
jgi:hypothetical protein